MSHYKYKSVAFIPLVICCLNIKSYLSQADFTDFKLHISDRHGEVGLKGHQAGLACSHWVNL